MCVNLQDFFLGKYRDLKVKKQMRKGLRFLFFSRLIIMKNFWNTLIDDFDVKAVNPLNVRFTPTATKIEEVDWLTEKIEDYAVNVMDKFPAKEQQDIILNAQGGGDKNELYIRNPKLTYYEAWIGDHVIHMYNNKILQTEPHPDSFCRGRRRGHRAGRFRIPRHVGGDRQHGGGREPDPRSETV